MILSSVRKLVIALCLMSLMGLASCSESGAETGNTQNGNSQTEKPQKGQASTEAGRRFVEASGGLVTSVWSDRAYALHDNVNVLEMEYTGDYTGEKELYSMFVFEVDLSGDVTIMSTCADDDPLSIGKDESHFTKLQIIREQLSAMQKKRPSVTVLGGVNGDFFYGATSAIKKNNLPHGVMHKDGVCLKGTFDGGEVCNAFAVLDDGTAAVLSQTEYAACKDRITEAIGGRQRLLDGGKIVSNTAKLDPRTAVGVTADGKKVVIVVVDGRNDSYSVGASYPILSKIMLAYGVTDAVNLDGGGSSTFVVREGNGDAKEVFKTHNRPSDKTGDRAVANGLAIVQK